MIRGWLKARYYIGGRYADRNLGTLRQLRWLVGLAVSAVAFYVAFVGVEWGPVRRSLLDADYLPLAATIPLLITLFFIRAQRWRLLLRPESDVSLLSAFWALNVGYFASVLLPLQLGELVRAYVLGETQGIAKVRLLSTIAVERVLDVLVLLALLGVLIPFVDLPSAALVTVVFVFLLALGLGLAILVAVVDRPRAEMSISRLGGLLPRRVRATGLRWGNSLLDGTTALSHPRIFAQVLVWTLLSWFTSATVIYLIMRAFSLDVPVAAAPFLLVATTFGFFVPSSPAAIGVYDAISIRSLTTVFSVAQEPATAYALTAHAIYMLPSSILGGVYIVWQSISLRWVQAWGEATDTVTSAPARGQSATGERRA